MPSSCTRTLTALTLASSCLLVPALARAHDVNFEPDTYLPVPVRLGSDTRLVMPEPFDDAWEKDDEVACTLLDARTLIIRPRTAGIEQRLTMRGRQTGTLYLARVSSTLPYAPVVTVHHQPATNTPESATRADSVLGLLRAMMRDTAPGGFQVLQSRRVILDQPPLRLTADQVWHSARMTGIRAHLTGAPAGSPLTVVPTDLSIHIPELGGLRAIGATSYQLDDAHPSITLYLIFSLDIHAQP